MIRATRDVDTADCRTGTLPSAGFACSGANFPTARLMPNATGSRAATGRAYLTAPSTLERNLNIVEIPGFEDPNVVPATWHEKRRRTVTKVTLPPLRRSRPAGRGRDHCGSRERGGWSEPAFADEDGIAGADLEGEGDPAAVELALGGAADLDRLLLGARGEAAGNGDGGFRRHVGDVGVLAGRGDLAEDEERPIGLDLHRHMRLADIAVAQLLGDGAGEAGGGALARRDGADQRHGDHAGGIDRIGVGEALLAEYDDAQLVAGVEPIGRLLDDRLGGGRLRHGGSGRAADDGGRQRCRHGLGGDRSGRGSDRARSGFAHAAGERGGERHRGQRDEEGTACPHEAYTRTTKRSRARLTGLKVNKASLPCGR